MTIPVNAQFQIADANLDDAAGIEAGGSATKLAPSDAIHDAIVAMAAGLPTQTGNSGKFLTTNGTAANWGAVDAFPSQTGHSGEFLSTNGTVTSWGTPSGTLPSQTGNTGKFLTTDGTSASWGTPSGGSGTSALCFKAGSPIANTTKYLSLCDSLNATESEIQSPIPFSGTMSNLYVRINSAVGAGKNLVLTVRKNGADTALTCTINGASQLTANDTTHSFSFTAGDLITLKAVMDNGAAGGQTINATVKVQ